MFKFLSENAGASTMRVAFFLIAVGCFVILLSVSFLIVWNAIHNIDTNWMAIGVFIATGLTPIYTSGAITKNSAKKIETNSQPQN